VLCLIDHPDQLARLRASPDLLPCAIEEVLRYPDAPHAFYADYRPSYRKGPAEDGWKKFQEWFKKHGVA
jgi:carboxymethylenebutenolidase